MIDGVNILAKAVKMILPRKRRNLVLDSAFGVPVVTRVAMGILDPTEVTRLALQNAASVAGLMITTEAMVADTPKDDSASPMPGGGMGGMDMM